jgi:hypothetical protein
LTTITLSRQAVVGIVIGCMCFVGILVAAMLAVFFFTRKPRGGTATDGSVDYSLDATDKAAASSGALSKASDGGPNCLGATALTLILADFVVPRATQHPLTACSGQQHTRTMHRADPCAFDVLLLGIQAHAAAASHAARARRRAAAVLAA